MQTWLVHMRSPLRLVSDLGLLGFLVFQLLVGGTVLAALIHVPFAVRLYWEWATISPDSMVSPTFLGFETVTLVSGYLMSALLGISGLARRRLLFSSGWALLLMPVYWLMLSLAAWRALWQLLRDPYNWEKTEHGLARTSRLVKDSA